MLLIIVTCAAAALVCAAVIFAFERWRLERPGGPYAAADATGLVLLVATAAAWLPRRSSDLALLWICIALVVAQGAITDRAKGIRGLRALAALVVAWLLWGADVGIHTVKVPFAHSFVNLGSAGLIVGMVWLAVCGSVFARVGTIPRVSLATGALTALTFLAIGRLQPANSSDFSITVAACVAVVCLAQLPFTRYLTSGGATGGAYALGVTIGVVAVTGALKNTAFLVALLPLLVISVPLFATAYSWLADLRRGRRRGFLEHRHRHLHEILLAQGYSHGQMSVVLILGEAIVCLLAVVLVWLIEISFIVKLLLVVVGLAAALVVPYVLLRLMRPAHPPQRASEYDVLGVRVHSVTMEQAMERVGEFIRQDRPHMIVTTDAGGIIRARDDRRVRDIMNNADLVTADGAGVVLAARLLNLGIDTRVAGCDMVEQICRVAAGQGRSVFLLGAAPGVADKAAEKLRERVPGLRIAGTRDGYFTPDQEPEIIARIRETRPAALFVALGAPRQEIWIVEHMEQLRVPVCIGIGGSFDVISGLKQRAPVWMQKCGLEWLYRSAKEPTRFRRLGALPRILYLTALELLRAPEDPAREPPSSSSSSPPTQE